MEKVKKWIITLLQAICLVSIAFIALLIFIGTIVMMINIVNNAPTTMFERASFCVVFVICVWLTLFCMAKK